MVDPGDGDGEQDLQDALLRGRQPQALYQPLQLEGIQDPGIVALSRIRYFSPDLDYAYLQ